MDVPVSRQGMAEVIGQIGASEVTYYRWRQEFGGSSRSSALKVRADEVIATHARRYCGA
jgi:hypothetical protein